MTQRQNPHRNPRRGGGVLAELGMTREDLRASLPDDVPRKTRSASGVEPPVGPGAVSQEESARSRRQRRENARGAFTEGFMGRASAGSRGDVDAGGLGVAESSAAGREHARRLLASAERICGCSTGADASCIGVCGMAERHAARHGTAAGVIEAGTAWADLTPEQRRASGLSLAEEGAPRRSALREFLAESGDIDDYGRPVRPLKEAA